MRLRPSSSALMMLGTVVSRATGLIRLSLQGAALHTGLLATTYNTANNVPNSVYFLLIGGALNSVLVPQLVRARVEQPDGGKSFEQRLVTLVLCVLACGSALAVWAAPQIVSVYIRDTPHDHAAFQLTVVFARFLLPQIFFYGMFFMLGQVLNARGRFGAMMWTPILNNVVLITMFGLYLAMLTVPDDVRDITPAEVRLLGIGTTIGIVLQAVSLVPYVRESGFRFRPRFDWRGAGLRKSVAAARWTLLYLLANQVAMVIVNRYAIAADSQAPNGGVGSTAYTYAQNIWSMPQSVVTVSIVTALLPHMSRAVAERRLDDVRDGLSHALRVTGVAIVPTAFFFLAFGPQLAALLFAHGSASAAATLPCGQMLQALGLGLIPFSAQYLLLRGFYAFEDTRTPFWTAALICAVNIALATACHWLLPVRWAVTGMAAGYAVSYGVGLLVTAALLRRRLAGRLDGQRLLRTYGKLGAAALVASAAGWAAGHAASATSPVLELAAGGGVMAALFLLAARVLRVGELNSLKNAVC
ncbi:murein biosynthesis integral membrane protein MurJ [Streptantibioticus rubrisoli]|uniref:Murein biosynthesis integral membrane protein MurJ n=1 Tax=Streptantibioticus rubrisoli TaxID=1387313 RepID=A0ABT1PKM0_9ACTN|nr:murein biosynthesis integral membrane protein MurJ [Streptantibioticus rubrisoli]MCQ4045899.1 murein biosynthesis integral membrane protein MurJ [Streptantibioticus rubrisoli]